jgi:hypothetical protein
MDGSEPQFPTDDELKGLPPEPHLMVVALAGAWRSYLSTWNRSTKARGDDPSISDDDYDCWLKWCGLGNAIFDVWRDERPGEIAIPTGDRHSDIVAITKMWQAMVATATEMHFRNVSRTASSNYAAQYAAILGTGFCYGFEDEALSRIRAEARKLEKMIKKTPGIDDWLRKRLLRRMAQLMKDLHGRMSSLDVIFGVWAEVNLLLKGTDEATKGIRETAMALGKLVLASAIVYVGGANAVPLLSGRHELPNADSNKAEGANSVPHPLIEILERTDNVTAPS